MPSDDTSLTPGPRRGPPGAGLLGLVLLAQVGVMLVAISRESLWIDEFWTAYFASLDSFQAFYELLLVPSGSQTPLHFLYYFLWGQVFGIGELSLRLANLPVFVLGQVSLLWVLRAYPPRFAALLLAVGCLHPMLWQYANEARPYVMLYAGAQMIVAYLLHIGRLEPGTRGANGVHAVYTAMFVGGAILLFGSSMLGVFWVLAAAPYVLYLHHTRLGWRYLARGAAPWLLALLLAVTGLLSVYYLNSLLDGAGASRISSTTLPTLLFNGYELLGLSGVGPGRLDLRSAGMAAIGPYRAGLLLMAVLVLGVLAIGWRDAGRQLGTARLLALAGLALLPVAIVVASGFIMNWRVLGRHLIAEVPLLNLLLALGLARLLDPAPRRGRALAVTAGLACLLMLAVSSASMRFAERHKKDDYQAAAALARQALADGQRVWWSADYLGAHYYRLPGEFDYMGELTSVHQPPACTDRPGVQAAANLPADCLLTLSTPDLVILSRPETFDLSGAIRAYLARGGFVKVAELPAISVWRPAAASSPAR